MSRVKFCLPELYMNHSSKHGRHRIQNEFLTENWQTCSAFNT